MLVIEGKCFRYSGSPTKFSRTHKCSYHEIEANVFDFWVNREERLMLSCFQVALRCEAPKKHWRWRRKIDVEIGSGTGREG